jgi:hypothetical protein
LAADQFPQAAVETALRSEIQRKSLATAQDTPVVAQNGRYNETGIADQRKPHGPRERKQQSWAVDAAT